MSDYRPGLRRQKFEEIFPGQGEIAKQSVKFAGIVAFLARPVFMFRSQVVQPMSGAFHDFFPFSLPLTFWAGPALVVSYFLLTRTERGFLFLHSSDFRPSSCAFQSVGSSLVIGSSGFI